LFSRRTTDFLIYQNGLENPGGFVYRGSLYEDILAGAYIFADQVTR